VRSSFKGAVEGVFSLHAARFEDQRHVPRCHEAPIVNSLPPGITAEQAMTASMMFLGTVTRAKKGAACTTAPWYEPDWLRR